MLYKIKLLNLLKLKNLKFNALNCEGFDIKSVNPSKVDKFDANCSFDASDASTIVDFHSKHVYANKVQNTVINLTLQGDDLIFFSPKDLGIFLGLKALKAEYLFVDSNAFFGNKVAEVVTISDLPPSFNISGQISWAVPQFEVINEWTDKDHVINLLKSKFPNYHDIFTLADKNILASKEAIECYVDKEEPPGLIPKDIIFSDIYKRIVLSDYKNFMLHYKTYLIDNIKESYVFFSKYDDIAIEPDKYTLATFNSQKVKEIAGQNLLPDEVEHVKWFWDNLFSDINKMSEFIDWYLENIKAKSFTSFMEVLQHFDNEFFKNEEIQKKVRRGYTALNRDYGSNFLIKVIPKDYFSDKEICKKFIKDEIIAGLNQANYIVNSHIQSFFKDDIGFYFELIDFLKSNFDFREAQSIAKSFVLRFNESSPYEIRKKVDYLKLQLLVTKIEISSNSYYSYLSNIYESLLYNDPTIMDFVIKCVPPENVVSLPKKFLFSIKDKAYLRKVISFDKSLLCGKNVPAELLYDIDNIIASGGMSHNMKFAKKEFKSIIKDKSTAYTLINSNAFLFTFLPQEYKKDKEISLLAVRSKPMILDDCDKSLLFDRDFCLSLLKSSNSFIPKIPSFHFKDSIFMKDLFKLIDNDEVSFSIFKHLPNEIFQCISAFKIQKGGLEEFANTFFSKQILTNSLKANTLDTSKKRIKI